MVARVTAPKHTPNPSSIPSRSIFLNTEFPVTTSIATVAANTIYKELDYNKGRNRLATVVSTIFFEFNQFSYF